jgi:hypothetical protein
MIEDDQSDCRKRDGSKASCNKRFHGMLALRDRRLNYTAKSQIVLNSASATSAKFGLLEPRGIGAITKRKPNRSMSALGQQRTCGREIAMSALGDKAHIRW